MTATLEAFSERRGQPTAAVVTSDGAAWSWPDLFDQFAPVIRAFARSRGASSPDDIVQEVFTTAIERFPGFEGDTSGLRSFLFTLAYRRVADEHRTMYRRQENLVADHQLTADDRPDIEEALTFQEEAAEAVRALDILGERERRVIEMRIIDESSPAEVASALGISNGNVRVIQARALMKIRKYLESRSGSMPSIGLVVAFLKGLGSDLPADGGLATWIEMLRAESARGTVKTVAAGAGSAIAAGPASTATVAGTVLKVGLVIALATGSTSSVDQVVPNPAGAAGSAGVVAENMVESELADTPAPIIDREPEIGTAPVAPTRPTRVPAPEPGSKEPGSEADAVSVESVTEPGQQLPAVGGDTPEVGASLEPVVEETVKTVEDVANGVVETVETVADTVTTVVDEAVEVVDKTVTETVGTVAETVDTVSETTGAVTDTAETAVDDVTSAVGGLVDWVTGGWLSH